VANERDDPALTAERRLERPVEDVKLPLATDERREPTRGDSIDPGTDRAEAYQLIHPLRDARALHLEHPEVAELEPAGDERRRRPP